MHFHAAFMQLPKQSQAPGQPLLPSQLMHMTAVTAVAALLSEFLTAPEGIMRRRNYVTAATEPLTGGTVTYSNLLHLTWLTWHNGPSAGRNAGARSDSLMMIV